jgi:hypothetical protein
MAGNTDRWPRAGSALAPDAPRVRWRNVIRTQVNSVRTYGHRNIGARIYQQTSLQFSVFSSQTVTNDACNLPSENLKFSARKVLLPQLDEINSAACSFRDFLQKQAATRGLVSGQLFAISDVTEQQET